jgi:hypothetical protein
VRVLSNLSFTLIVGVTLFLFLDEVTVFTTRIYLASVTPDSQLKAIAARARFVGFLDMGQ